MEEEVGPYECVPHENETLLPPLPSSSSSLPIDIPLTTEVPNSSKSPIPEKLPYQVSAASLESMLHNVTLERASTKIQKDDQIDLAMKSDPHENEKQVSLQMVTTIASKDVYIRSNSSTNLESQGSTTNNSTRQGSVSSLNSTISGTSNRAMLKKIKSGFKKLSSPLTSTPKLEPKEVEEVKEDSIASVDITDEALPPVFKRPFLPRHTSTLSNASNSSSASSIIPASVNKHSHTNSSTSNRTGDNASNIITTPLSSPIITINEKFRSRASSEGSDYHFPQAQHHLNNSESFSKIDRFALDAFDTIDEKVSYIESLKKQMENEDVAYKITERRLLSSGWASSSEIADLRKKRDSAMKHWRENIDRLEDVLYRSAGVQ